MWPEYIASKVFLIFTTELHYFVCVYVLFALFSDEPEVFLPEYSQTEILHAAHSQRVVNLVCHCCNDCILLVGLLNIEVISVLKGGEVLTP